MDDNEDLDDSISRAYSHKPYTNHNPSTSNPVLRKFRTRDPQFPRRNPNHFAEDDDDESNDPDEDDALNFYRHPKKRRLRSLNSTYELAPRVNGNKSEEEWSERGASVLLDVWGERFAELGRKSLRSEDWRDVAERVSDISGVEKSEIQCRKMMDSLKRKYKKEKARVPGSRPSRWELYRKMDALLSPWQGSGLACGVDSGEFVFADTSVYLDQSNGYDEMRDSPAESEASDEDEPSSNADVAPAREASMRELACSIQKFGEIYGKVESSKRKQMAEIESMRRDFGRDLELQKKQIMERTRAEIARIREDEEEDEDEDSEDLSE